MVQLWCDRYARQRWDARRLVWRDCSGQWRVTLATQRLAYDFHAAADAMLREGYADAYAQAITTGLWPSLDVLPDLERAATGQKLAESSVVLTPALA